MFGITEENNKNCIDNTELENLTSIKEVKRYDLNPFISELLLTEILIYKKEKTFKDEGINFLLAKEIGKRDKAKFIRLFEFNLDLTKLKGNSAKLLLYILYHKINYDVSILYLPSTEITQNVGISNISSINESIIELIKLKYIAKQIENNWYWINPSKFYKGDRKRINT